MACPANECRRPRADPMVRLRSMLALCLRWSRSAAGSQAAGMSIIRNPGQDFQVGRFRLNCCRRPRGFVPAHQREAAATTHGAGVKSLRKCEPGCHTRSRAANNRVEDERNVGLLGGSFAMDATRPRRSRDAIRQRWYGSCRTLRFARHMQFLPPDAGQVAGRHFSESTPQTKRPGGR
jgi:hypothetical protein